MAQHCKARYLMQSCGRCKKYHEPKFLRNDRRIFKEQLQQAIRILENSNNRHQTEGFYFNRKPDETRNCLIPILRSRPSKTTRSRRSTRRKTRTINRKNGSSVSGIQIDVRGRDRVSHRPSPSVLEVLTAVN